MKKILLLLFALFLILQVYPQVQQEYAFDDQSSILFHSINLENSGEKMCVINNPDSITYEIVLYNPDFSEYKMITINLGSIFAVSSYNTPYLDITYISESMFDNDEDIDVMAELSYYDSDDEYYSQVLIFNEDGSVYFSTDIDDTNAWIVYSSASSSSIVSSIMEIDGDYKLVIDAYYFNKEAYSYDVYSLPDSTTEASENYSNSLEENSLRVYPNPSVDYINVNYRLAGNQSAGSVDIVDNQGRTVKKVRVNGRQGTVKISVSELQNGYYYYRLNSKRGVSRSEAGIITK